VNLKKLVFQMESADFAKDLVAQTGILKLEHHMDTQCRDRHGHILVDVQENQLIDLLSMMLPDCVVVQWVIQHQMNPHVSIVKLSVVEIGPKKEELLLLHKGNKISR